MLTTEFVTGSPNWLDLGSTDTQASAAFYAAVFGWSFMAGPPETGGYGFLQKDGKTVAGLGPLMNPEASPAWKVYFSTPDADATAKAVEQGGGTIASQPMDVMTAGRMADLADPQGAEFAIWQPGDIKGVDLANEADALVWVELHVADTAAAANFYGTLFHWRTATDDMPGMPYTILSTSEGEQEASSFGGIAPFMEDSETPRWLVYFGAEDVDGRAAAATEAGGSVLVPPMDIPGVGRFAILADPAGAQFALLKGTPSA